MILSSTLKSFTLCFCTHSCLYMLLSMICLINVDFTFVVSPNLLLFVCGHFYFDNVLLSGSRV